VLEGTLRSSHALPDRDRQDCHVHGRLPTDRGRAAPVRAP
jgi:hypothetical protein